MVVDGVSQQRNAASTDRAPHWTARLHSAASAIAFIGALNALMLVFSLCGAVVLGIGPAIVAAAHCVRERRLGRLHRIVPTFAATWRSAMLSGNVAMLPLLAAAAALGWSYLAFSVAGPAATPQRIATLIALALVVAAISWASAICAHYDIRPARVSFVAVRVALAQPVASVVQLIVVIVLGYASSWLGALLIFFTLGTWSYVSTTFALHTFADSDAMREEHDSARLDADVREAVPTRHAMSRAHMNGESE